MATVIKAGQPGAILARRLETFDLADHLAEAEMSALAACREADRVLADSRVASDRARAEAEQRGHQQGLTKGYEEGKAAGHADALREANEKFTREQAQLCQMMSGVVTEIERLKRDLLIEANHDVLRLAMQVAECVTRRAAAVDSSAAVANLADALKLVGAKSDVVVRIHPADAEAMRTFAAGVARDLSSQQHVTVVEDATVSPGGCIVRTEKTEIDATLDTQIEQIAALLLPPSSPGANGVV